MDAQEIVLLIIGAVIGLMYITSVVFDQIANELESDNDTKRV